MSGSRRRVRIEQAGSRDVGPGDVRLADLRERPAAPFPWLRTLVLSLLAIGAVIGAALGIIRAMIDPVAMKADAEAALRHLAGREVRIVGPLTIESYFGATVAVDDIQIPSPPGAAQPLMARIGRLEAELSLASLFTSTVDVRRLVVVQPDIRVEIDAEGRSNWGLAASEMPPPTGNFRSWPRNLHVKEGRVTVADTGRDRTTVVAVRRISAAEVEAGGLLSLSADLAVGSQRIAVSGQVGTLSRLLDRAATTPWPVRLTLDTQGVRLVAAGSFRQPLGLAGYSLKLDASVADSAALAPFIPVRLPVLRTVVATARVADTGGPWPDIAGARLQLGASDLSLWVPGLKVDALEVNIPALDQGSRGELLGTLHGVPVRVQAALGAIGGFLSAGDGRGEPFAIDVAADLGESRLTVKGAIADPARRRGLDVAVGLRVYDLQLFSPIVGQRLPSMRNLSFDARIVDGAEGFLDGVSVRDAAMGLPQGDLAGSFVLGFGGGVGGRPSLRGRVKGGRLDADALAEPVSALIGPVSVFTPESHLRPASRVDPRVIPNRTLGLEMLDAADVDLTVELGELRLLAATYRDVSARLALAQGRLALDPVTADLPSGRATLRLMADGRDRRHPMMVRATIPGIPVQPLLAGSGRRDNLFGTVELDAELRAEGGTLRELAATVTGHLGVAVVEGDIDARLLLDPLSEVMLAARVPVNLGTQLGVLSRLRCLAGRLEAEAGQVRITTFAVDGGRMQFVAEGGFDLRDESMAMRLRPALKGTAMTATVPLRLGGTFGIPRLQLEPVAGAARPGESRSAAVMRPGELPEICVPALAVARAGNPGPMPGDAEARPALVRPRPQQR